MSLKYEKPEDAQFQEQSPEQFLENKKRAMRSAAYTGMALGAVVVLGHFIVIPAMGLPLFLIFRSIFFAIGVLAVLGGIWGYFQANKLTMADYVATPEAVRFSQRGAGIKPYFSYVIIGSLVAVTLAQLSAGLDESIVLAGLVKPDVWDKHQFWRLVTAGAMHIGFLHLYFNSQALYGFGNAIEYLSNRAHLAIVFLFAVVGGNIMSVFLMPQIPSVGASGGILGLVGYLAIYGYRRKSQLPPGFLKNMLVNIGFIAAFGIIAYQMVDNAAHLGGLIVGAAYGFIQVPKDLSEDPRKTDIVTAALGYASLVTFLGFAVLSILLIMKKITL